MSDNLDDVSKRARAVARCYVALAEAIMQEGVPEDVARFEARMIAIALVYPEEEDAPDPWE